jgi:hypothetical protein
MFFASNQKEAADALVRSFHYSKSIPAAVQFVGTWHLEGGLFGDLGEALAACYFTIPATRWNEPVFELARLVRKEDVNISLTRLISKCLKYIAKHKMSDLIVSFADSTQGHHGGIYQAASWDYNGKRDNTIDGLIINGTFIPGRSCNSLYGTRSVEKLKAIKPSWNIEPHNAEGKHLYWKALNSNGKKQAERMGLKSLPYPKPDIEI